MQLNFTCTLLLSLFGASAKYVYIKEEKTWPEAQQYCQQEYAGLAPISNQRDIVKIMKLVDENYPLTWIGKEKGDREREKWMFWGGGRISGFFPAQNESTGIPEEGSGSVPESLYEVFLKTAPFFCYKPVLVMEKKSWEEAWSYCRRNHNMLASMASKAELQLIQRELRNFPTTKHVWIGLHFFPGDGWLWVDSEPLDYEVWGSGGKPQCPKVNRECAALKVKDFGGIGVTSSGPESSLEKSGSNQGGSQGDQGGTQGIQGGNNGNQGGNNGNQSGNSGNQGGNNGNQGGNNGNQGGNNGNQGGNNGNQGGNNYNQGGNNGNQGGNNGNQGGNNGNQGGNNYNQGGNNYNQGGNNGNQGGSGDSSSESESPSADLVWEAHGCEEKLHFICY